MRSLKLAVVSLAMVAIWTAPNAAHAAESAVSTGVPVLVVHAIKACFSDQIRVTGFLVPRKVAVVNVDRAGYVINDVMVSVGDRVVSGQALAGLVRQSTGDQRPPPGATAGPRSMVLYAPVSGLVMRSAAAVGAMASPQAGPLFQIISDDEIELEVQVPSLQMPKLKPGATARISFGFGPERIGRVRRVGAEIDPINQLGSARISLDNDPSLRVGMFARATIDASRSCGVSVPRAAIFYRTEGTSVQVVRNNTIETRLVHLGLVSGDNVEIRAGLSDGDTIVANAGTSLHDGDKVRATLASAVDQGMVQ